VLGLLSGPAVAFGAAGAFGSEAEASVTEAAPVAIVTTTEAPVPTTIIPDAADDLETACAIDGPALVSAEGAGTITDVEQAALDALRDICSNAGLYLADADMPEVEEIVVIQTVTVSAAPATEGSGNDDEYEGEHEDEEEDEHEDEEEDEHEDEEEDEDEEVDEHEDEEDEDGEDH